MNIQKKERKSLFFIYKENNGLLKIKNLSLSLMKKASNLTLKWTFDVVFYFCFLVFIIQIYLYARDMHDEETFCKTNNQTK